MAGADHRLPRLPEIVLDVTIVGVALPSIRRISDSRRAHSPGSRTHILTLGGLLLLAEHPSTSPQPGRFVSTDRRVDLEARPVLTLRNDDGKSLVPEPLRDRLGTGGDRSRVDELVEDGDIEAPRPAVVHTIFSSSSTISYERNGQHAASRFARSHTQSRTQGRAAKRKVVMVAVDSRPSRACWNRRRYSANRCVRGSGALLISQATGASGRAAMDNSLVMSAP